MGLKAPETLPETLAQAKDRLFRFFSEFLNIQNIKPEDIDCAHRVGYPGRDGAQTMLVRFFRREICEYLQRSKKMLKGRPIVMFEDTSYKNRQLLNALTNRAEVESTWCIAGRVWAKLHHYPNKVKFSIIDDLDVKLA